MDLIEAATGWPKWARIAAAVVAALLALVLLSGLGFGAWKLFDWFNDREAVSQDRAERRAELATRVLEGERAANRNDEHRRVIRDRQDDELETAIDEAVTENPDETNLPAGPAVRAVLRELREQAAGSSDPAA